MVLLIISIILLLFVISILFVPVAMVIDTVKNEYYVNLRGFIKAQFIQGPVNWKIRLRLLFLPFTLNTIGKDFSKRSRKLKKRQKKIHKMINPFIYINAIIRFFNSIQIKKLYANIDTDDYPLNAKLIALTPIVNHGNISVNINFENYNIIEFKAITYLYKLVGIAINIYITKKVKLWKTK